LADSFPKELGKASDAFQKGAVIGYKHEEIQVRSFDQRERTLLNIHTQLGTYEILVGDMNGSVSTKTIFHFQLVPPGLRWVDASGHLDVSRLGYTPVEGGREDDGTPLYIAEAPHNGAVHPGKASEKLDGEFDSCAPRLLMWRQRCLYPLRREREMCQGMSLFCCVLPRLTTACSRTVCSATREEVLERRCMYICK
jgi:hypothetical protein